MITIKNFKEWKDKFNDRFYKEMSEYFSKFKDKDKRHNRIYFKLKVEQSSDMPIPQEISDYMNWIGCPIIDYKKGLCKVKGREVRIGKFFNDTDRKDLLKIYSESRQSLKNTDNLSVVICRHPYDIIGMSTNRGWSTCIDLNDKKYGGKHLHSLGSKMTSGCLIAYLIRDDDRNINNPVSRIAILSYNGTLYCDTKCYGTSVKEFIKFTNDWVLDYSKNKTNKTMKYENIVCV